MWSRNIYRPLQGMNASEITYTHSGHSIYIYMRVFLLQTRADLGKTSPQVVYNALALLSLSQDAVGLDRSRYLLLSAVGCHGHRVRPVVVVPIVAVEVAALAIATPIGSSFLILGPRPFLSTLSLAHFPSPLPPQPPVHPTLFSHLPSLTCRTPPTGVPDSTLPYRPVIVERVKTRLRWTRLRSSIRWSAPRWGQYCGYCRLCFWLRS